MERGRRDHERNGTDSSHRCMMNAVTEYINANCPPSETEPDPEPAATPTTAVPNVPRTLKSESMSYVFDHSHMLTDTQRAELEAQAKEDADKKAKEYVVNAIQRCAADHVAETTISVVQLPSDEMKDESSDVKDGISVRLRH